MPPPRDPRLDLKATVNGKLVDRGIRHATQLERLKAGETRKVASYLNREVFPDLTEKLRMRLDRIASRGFDRGPWTTRRYKDMVQRMGRQITDGMNGAHQQLRASLKDLAELEGEWQVATLRQAAGPFGLEFQMPARPTLRAIVDKQPVRGLRLKKWFKNLEASTKNALGREIGIGMAQGETTDQIVRRISGTAARKFADGQLAAVQRHAETIVRTSVSHTAAQARELTYAENADLITGILWVSTLDGRTSEICIGLDGQVFRVDGGERPPAHPNCRSSTVPQLKSWKELGIDLEEAPIGTRASMSGQVPSDITYRDWIQTQPPEIQDQVLGRGKAQLMRSGVSVDKFFDARNRPLTLTQIRKLEGLDGDG
jgi:SPP1 gp7 family putative phage head morphogenesis protein